MVLANFLVVHPWRYDRYKMGQSVTQVSGFRCDMASTGDHAVNTGPCTYGD